MSNYAVYLFKAPECIRGWLAYLRLEHAKDATMTVLISAKNGADAKNRAQTAANNGFKGVEILKCNYTHSLFGIDNFPELKEQLSTLGFNESLSTMKDT